MPARTVRSAPSRGTVALAVIAVALAILVVAPVASLAAPAPTSSVTPGSTTQGVTGSATWNGVNIATANTSSSAFHISFNGAVTVVYGWSQPPSRAGWSISDARLQIFYFGFALATRDITTSSGATTGNITMGNWSTGPLQYILEGSFQLTASLLAGNGTTAWSQSFWVDVLAPFAILAALPIVLIVIAIYELYGVATVGKQAALKRQRKGDAEPPTTSTAPPATGSPEPTPTDATPPPSEGGGS